MLQTIARGNLVGRCLNSLRRRSACYLHFSSRVQARDYTLPSDEGPSRKSLSDTQCLHYKENGYLVVENLFDVNEREELVEAMQDFHRRASKLTESTGTFILSHDHSEDNPVLERVVCPSLRHPAFANLIRSPKLLDVIEDLIGPSFRYMPQDKVNAKPSSSGLPIPWHQDWSFFPHTNDSVLTVSVLMDDSSKDNGCLQVIPGSHEGPLYDHFKDGCFANAITDENFTPRNPHYLEAPAGSVTIHHVRLVHGSAANISHQPRRVVCFIYTAMDAWPLLGVAGPDFQNVGPVDWDLFNATLVRGEPTDSPRLKSCPVRLPLPLRGATSVIGEFTERQIPL